MSPNGEPTRGDGATNGRTTDNRSRSETPKETVMFKIRTAMLALAAVASLGIASLATTTSADARGFGGGFSRGGGGGHVGMRMSGARHIGGMRHVGGRVHLGQRIRIGHRHPNWCRIHGR